MSQQHNNPDHSQEQHEPRPEPPWPPSEASEITPEDVWRANRMYYAHQRTPVEFIRTTAECRRIPGPDPTALQSFSRE